jgi:hypothetical protein
MPLDRARREKWYSGFEEEKWEDAPTSVRIHGADTVAEVKKCYQYMKHALA